HRVKQAGQDGYGMWSNLLRPVSVRGGSDDRRAAWLDGNTRGDRKMGTVEVVELPRQALIDLLPEPYVAVDVATRRFMLVNAAAQRLLGYTEAELRDLSPADVLESADGTRLELAFQSVV